MQSMARWEAKPLLLEQLASISDTSIKSFQMSTWRFDESDGDRRCLILTANITRLPQSAESGSHCYPLRHDDCIGASVAFRSAKVVRVPLVLPVPNNVSPPPSRHWHSQW